MTLTPIFLFMILLLVLGLFFYNIGRKMGNASKFFICKHDFPIDVSFEFVKQSRLTSFMETFFSNEREMQTGYRKFDDAVYVSTDLKAIRHVLKDEEIRREILEIIEHKNVYGIYIEDNTIKLRTKNISPKNRDLHNEVENWFDAKVAKLRDNLVEAFKKAIPMANKENLVFSNDMQTKIRIIESFYWSLLITSGIFLGYFCGMDLDPYFHLKFFSFKQIIFSGLLLFIPILFMVLHYTKDTIRRHLLVYKTVFMLLPACMLASSFFIYYLNINLDNSAVSVSTETVHTQKVRRGKSTNYYLIIDNPKNEEFAKYSRIDLSADKYYKIPGNGKVQLSLRKGYFNVPYVRMNEFPYLPE